MNLVFLFTAILSLASLASYLIGNGELAGHLAIGVWMLFSLLIGYYAIMKISDFAKTGNVYGNFIKKIDRKTTIFFVIILLVSILYKAGLKSEYYFGGDDTRIFYLHPIEYFNNFASHIATNTGMSDIKSFFPPVTIMSYSLLIVVLKTLVGGLNLQSIMYTANIIFGLIFFYMLQDYVVREKTKISRIVFSISSLMYVFSIFHFYVLYSAKLISIYLVSIFPLFLYLFFKSVREKKIYLLALLALILTIFSTISICAPWTAAMTIVSLPVILLEFFRNKLGFIKHTVLLVVFFGFLNLHWIVYIPHSSVMQKASEVGVSLGSQDFRLSNAEGIKTVSLLNHIFYPLLNTFHRQIQANFNWPFFGIFNSWYLKILPMNIIYIFTVISAGIIIGKKSRNRSIYLASVFGLLLSLYFYTVNMGNLKTGSWGSDLFIWLNNNVFGFVMFRNMYDKFAPAMAFAFSLSFGISLNIIVNKIKNKYLAIYLTLIALVVTLLNAMPYFLNRFDNHPIWTTNVIYNSLTKINSDYYDLTSFVKYQDDDARYGWLPLAYGNISQIQDDVKNNHYNVGVSPFLAFTGKNDFSGALSFGDYNQYVIDGLLEGEYKSVAQYFQIMNVRYLIVNHTISKDLAYSYIFQPGLIEAQNDEYSRVILGEKVKDFGERYSLYRINSEYDSRKIFVTDSEDSFPNVFNNAKFQRISEHEYKVELSNLRNEIYLVFLEPFSSDWVIKSSRGNIHNTEHDFIYGYANAWKLSSDQIKNNFADIEYTANNDGSLDLSLTIYYKPFDLYYPTLIFSGISAILMTLYIIVTCQRQKKDENI